MENLLGEKQPNFHRNEHTPDNDEKFSMVQNAQWNRMQYSANHSRHLYFTNNSEENMRNLAVWLGVEVLYCGQC